MLADDLEKISWMKDHWLSYFPYISILLIVTRRSLFYVICENACNETKWKFSAGKGMVVLILDDHNYTQTNLYVKLFLCRVPEFSRLHPIIPQRYVPEWNHDMKNRKLIVEVRKIISPQFIWWLILTFPEIFASS